MAKIRNIGTDVYFKFQTKMKELKLGEDALLAGLLGDHDFKFKNLETPDKDIGLDPEQLKDWVEEQTALKDMIDSLNNELVKMAEDKLTILAKHTKLVAKQKETILNKSGKLKDYRVLVSSLKKDNKKLARQIKALTVVEDSEEEEIGDSESGIHGPTT